MWGWLLSLKWWGLLRAHFGCLLIYLWPFAFTRFLGKIPLYIMNCHGRTRLMWWVLFGWLIVAAWLYTSPFRAQLFEGRLALNPGLNLTRVSFSFVQKHFLGQFSVIFIEHRIINLLTKRIKLNLLYELSYLNSNFALTLGYLNPGLKTRPRTLQIMPVNVHTLKYTFTAIKELLQSCSKLLGR